MALPRFVPHYSTTDYELWEGRWELWSGVAVAMSPSPSQRHQEIASNLHFLLRKSLAEQDCSQCRVLFEMDWRVNEDTVVRPDLLIVCNPARTRWVEETPVFVAEILSETTRNHDLLYKRELYEHLGVRFYLIINPETEKAQLFCNSPDGYLESESEFLEFDENCRVHLNLEGLFA